MMELDQLSTVAGMVRAGLGITIVPSLTLFHFADPQPRHAAAACAGAGAARVPGAARRPAAVDRRRGAAPDGDGGAAARAARRSLGSLARWLCLRHDQAHRLLQLRPTAHRRARHAARRRVPLPGVPAPHRQRVRRTGRICAAVSHARPRHRVRAHRRPGRAVQVQVSVRCAARTVFHTEEGNEDRGVSVAVGAFAEPDFPPPRDSVYDCRRHAWVQLPAGVTVHDKDPT